MRIGSLARSRSNFVAFFVAPAAMTLATLARCETLPSRATCPQPRPMQPVAPADCGHWCRLRDTDANGNQMIAGYKVTLAAIAVTAGMADAVAGDKADPGVLPDVCWRHRSAVGWLDE